MLNSNRHPIVWIFVLLILWTIDLAPVHGQRQFTVKERINAKGEVHSIKTGEITIRGSKTGKTQTFKIQDKDDKAISLDGGKAIFRSPAKISVTGSLPLKLIEQGMIVEFNTPANKRGKSEQPIKTINVIQSDASDLKIEPESKPAGNDFVPARVVGRVNNLRKNRLLLEIPDSRYASSGRAYFTVDPKAELNVNQDSLSQVIAGDTITSLRGVQLSNGALIVAEIDISLTADREKATLSFNDQLKQKFSGMSDEPGKPRELTSDHFILYTDISDRSAAVLLAKLERMYGLISKYFGKRPRQGIECYVVRRKNLGAWQGKIPPDGARTIAGGAGLTVSKSNGRVTKSIVYSIADHDVVQHESVHAYCAMAFGTTGPVWYSEGMAEMGQYWEEGQLEVNIDSVVIDYLTHAEPKKLKDIVAAGQITGDSWKAYAWRWALCHLLANNPNYANRFKRLGITLMSRGNDSFDNAFGSIAPLISFEYDQFIENFGNGYRVDLCVWDWNSKPKKLKNKSARTKVEVRAQAGWQATKLTVTKGDSYEFAAQGKWKTDAETEVDADGNSDGVGALEAVVFNDFSLSKPFTLGKRGSFTGPSDGHLFIRCKDDWTDLSNNDGKLSVFFKRTKN